MLMIELKKIRTEKYIMSAYCPAMRDNNMITNGIANKDSLTPKDHAAILIGLQRSGTKRVWVLSKFTRMLC